MNYFQKKQGAKEDPSTEGIYFKHTTILNVKKCHHIYILLHAISFLCVINIFLAAAQWKADYKNKPMDTIFIREVKDDSPAHNAGLNKGDRIIAINNHPLSGKSYSDIIHLILKR